MENLAKLTQELLDAGLPVLGINADGIVFWDGDPTAQQETDAAAIIAAFDPIDYPELQRQAAQSAAQSGLSDLRTLDPGDAVYVFLARNIATAYGDNPETIIDETSAVNYITGLSDWGTMTIEQRRFLGRFMRAVADGFTIALANFR